MKHLHTQITLTVTCVCVCARTAKCVCVCVCFDLVKVLEALVSKSDRDGEDGVGGVLVKTRLTVSSKQSHCPAPEHTHTLP